MDNHWKHRIVRVGLAAKRRLPEPIQRRIPSLGDRRRRNPELSVIIPVYNCEDFIAESLDSVLNSAMRNLEIIVVDDGSTDNSLAILREYEAREPRITVFSQANAGQGAARNLGVSHAKGTFITFVDADDTVPAFAYRRMIRVLRASGSDFAVGKVRRLQNGHASFPPLQQQVHTRDRIGTNIDEFPEAMLDVLACNRMIRRDFWNEKVGGFRGGIAYEDHVPGVVGYVRATSFDVLQAVTYNWRIRENQTSTSQQKHRLQNLLDRIEVKAEAEAVLRAEASPAVINSWVGRVLDADLPLFIDHAGQQGPEYRQALQDALAHYLEMATDETLSTVRFFQKARAQLVSEGRWDDVEQVAEWFRTWGTVGPTRVQDGRVFSADDFSDLLGTPLPARVLELSPADTAHRAQLETARWNEDGSALEITGWSFPRGVDLTGRTPVHELTLRHPSGRSIVLDWTPELTPQATVQTGDRAANYDAAGFRTSIDRALLDETGNWSLHVRTTVDGVTREGPVLDSAFGGSARSGLLAQVDPEQWVCPRWDSELGFTLRVVLDPPAITRATRTSGGLLAQVRSNRALDSASLYNPVHRTHAPLKLKQLEDGTWEVLVSTGELNSVVDPTPGFARLLNVMSGEDELPVVWPASVPVSDAEATEAHQWFVLPTGVASIQPRMERLEVTDVRVTDDLWQVDFTSERLSEAELGQLRLANKRTSIAPVRLQLGPDGSGTASFRLVASAFGGPTLPAPSGLYSVECAQGDGTLKARATVAWAAATPRQDVIHGSRVRTVRSTVGDFNVYLDAPLAADEIGTWAQHQLRTAYQQTTFEPEDAVLLQCYRGEFATDSQKAIATHLHATRPDLTVYWGVKDNSVVVPEGGVPLVMNSRDWYSALGRVRYLCNNIDFDPFFRKGPHQKFLSTFHGYPFKSMGRTFWEGKRYSPARIAYEIERRNQEWDTILVPSQMCVEMYRDEYDWHGETLVLGYPRSDALVNATPADAARVRETLGIPADALVVLYAPTYRDNLTTRLFAAKRFDELQLEELTTRLGPDAVVLLRGHNNNQREDSRVLDQARVIDVTDHPDINDLTIAADVAILDYSSLRFDWALTNKPMVFFVPDRDTYFAGRPPLFGFEESAPGPLLETTGQVADWLTDLPRLRSEYAPAIAAFNNRFNSLQNGHSTENVVNAFFGTAGE